MLARCPNCGATVSNRSDYCPQCHGRLRAPRRDTANTVFGWTFAAFNALMIVWIGFYLLTGRTTLRTAEIEGDMAGTPVAGGMGIGFLLLLWVLGLLILGLCAMFNFAHRPVEDDDPQRRLTR